MDPVAELDCLLKRADRRLRRRRVRRAGAIGAWIGVVACGAVLLASRLWWPLPVDASWVAVPLVAAGLALGFLVGAAWPGLSRREIALLLDRRLGTDELFVTALHVRRQEGEAREAVLARLRRQLPDPGAVRAAVPLGLPRHARWIPVALLGVLLILLLPQAAPIGRAEAKAPQAAEAERLERRLTELDEAYEVELPDEIRQDLEELIADMKAERLTPEEAAERLDELGEQLEQASEELAQSADLLKDLQEAAEALSASKAAEQLAKALREGDMEGAGEAARELQRSIEQGTPEERQQAGEALEKAGERLAGSSDPQLKQAGEAMRQAGQKLRDGAAGKPGQQGAQEPGEGGSEQGQGQKSQGEGSPGDLDDLARQLERSQQLAEKAKQDAERLEQSQQMNGACEAGKQRLGGEAGVARGEGEGQGQGAGQAVGEPGSGFGVGHTWEDQGEFAGGTTHQDADRTSARTSGEAVDDFEQLYRSVRMEGADGLVTPIEGEIDELGRIEYLPIRRGSSDEQATAPLLDVPDGYREAADEALSNERIPPAYREAVKRYFDGME